MLSDFYKSDKWVKLVKVLRLERLNANGELICECCGKPITHKYDCIGHHKTELTEENYERAEISLNPENIALVHHRCHNKIHDRLGLTKVKQVFIVYGSPLSGKTTWVKENASPGDLIVDMDSIWESISGQPRYTKPKRLTSTAFMVRDCLIDSVRVRNGNWLNAYIVGGYALISERERLARSLGAREILIDTSKEECLERLKGTERDTAEYRRYIEEWWEKFLKYPPPYANG